jgi:hypothetical protein
VTLIRKYSLFPLLLILSACTVNPFRTAETVEQKADALYGEYVIAKDQGAALLGEPTIPDTRKRTVATLMVRTKAPADSLNDALNQYSAIKAEVAAGKTSADKLLIAQQNMDRWLAEATPLINDLVNAVGGLTK